MRKDNNKKPINHKAEITNREIKKEFTYKSTTVLTLSIDYPQIKLEHSPIAEGMINRKYQAEADSFLKYASTKLLKGAIDEYNYSMQNGFPFRPYDAVMVYSVMLNQNCHLSTYYDRYEYTGGAHGNTVRASDSFSLQTGRRISLRSLFFPMRNYRRIILDQIIKIANREYEKNPGIFFENYTELIVQYFNEQSFYLNPDALSIYYQQYEVGPYSSGIIVFDIPYKALGIKAPECWGG